MHDAVTTLRNPTGPIRSWLRHCILLPIVLLNTLNAIAADSNPALKDIHALSLVNHPVLSDVHWQPWESSSSVQGELQFSAEFVNACYANQGVNARYIDRINEQDTQNNLRLIFVEQNPSPHGCPEIFQPIKQRYRITMPPSPPLRQLLLLNYVDVDRREDLRILILELNRPLPSAAPASQPLSLTLQPFAQSAVLPNISKIKISTTQKQADKIRYEVELKMPITNACALDQPFKILWIEDRQTLETHTVADWLLVLAENPKCRRKKPTNPIVKHIHLQRSIPTNIPRRLVLLNPSLSIHNSTTQPIITYPILP